MFAVYKVRFSKLLPGPEQVLDAVRERTGLHNIEYVAKGKRKHILHHASFQKPIFSLDFDSPSKEVVIWTTSPKINYLLEATINALMELGGSYDFQINDLARKPWATVNESYKERSIVDISKLGEI